jgi:hypothetical protein
VEEEEEERRRRRRGRRKRRRRRRRRRRKRRKKQKKILDATLTSHDSLVCQCLHQFRNVYFSTYKPIDVTICHATCVAAPCLITPFTRCTKPAVNMNVCKRPHQSVH